MQHNATQHNATQQNSKQDNTTQHNTIDTCFMTDMQRSSQFHMGSVAPTLWKICTAKSCRDGLMDWLPDCSWFQLIAVSKHKNFVTSWYLWCAFFYESSPQSTKTIQNIYLSIPHIINSCFIIFFHPMKALSRAATDASPHSADRWPWRSAWDLKGDGNHRNFGQNHARIIEQISSWETHEPVKIPLFYLTILVG